MNEKQRKTLFLSFLIFFFIFAPILILYTQGYRIDFENKRIIQTGGFYFEIEPKQASIYLDDKFYRKTDIFFSSTLIENLLPKKYNVKILKEDYFPWEKNLTIQEKQVTEASGITLFPTNFDFQTISDEVENFWVSPKENKIVWEENSNNAWSLKLYDLNKELKSHLISEEQISRNNVDLIDLSFSQDGEKIYFEAIASEQLKDFTLDINKGFSSLKEQSRPEIQEEIIAYQSFDNKNYYLTQEGGLYKTDQKLTEKITSKEKLNKDSFNVKRETPYDLYVFPEFVFLKEDNTTYLLNQETKEFEKFSDNIQDLKLSPDNKTIAYFKNGELWIIPIEKTKIYEAKKEVFLVRFSESIKNIFWINEKYLIFSTQNNIKITEIDNRDNLNVITLTQFKPLEIFWSPITEKIYILTEDNLWHSKEILP